MENDRFISLLTKDLSEGLTDAEREEYVLLLQGNEAFRQQKEVLEDYWKQDRASYAENAAMFRKVLEKIAREEQGGSAGQEALMDGRGGADAPDSEISEDEMPEDEVSIVEVPEIEGDREIEWVPSRRRISPIAWYGAAAVLFAAVVLFTLQHHTSSKETENANTVHWLAKNTQPRAKSLITLADGTTITLNAATTLRYPEHFDDSVREVYLDGEAYFDVAKDVAHPFIIHAHKMNIRVLGTAFNIKSYQSEEASEATLIKGSIEVTLNDRPSDRIILKPKEKLVVQNDSVFNAVVMKGPVTVDSSLRGEHAGKSSRYMLTNLTYFPNTTKTVVETSWVENKLVFSDQDFSQISGQLERWYGVHITFGNEKVKEYRFTGLFEKETLSEALDALSMIEHFHYKISGSNVYIY